MQERSQESELYERAKKRVEEIKGFYIHLGVFMVVNLGLFAINMLTSPDTLWFYWPLLGWGVGVAIHAFTLLAEGRFLGRSGRRERCKSLFSATRRA